MSTILLCWYAMGWVATSFAATESGVLRLMTCVFAFISAPFFVLIIPLYYLTEYGDTVLWRRP